jgi:hypothetical protein
MMRRLFWLLLGAVLGVTGYRRATALARSLRPAIRPAPRAQALTDFAADVREGMAVYMERQARAPASTLEGHRPRGLPRGRSATEGQARRPALRSSKPHRSTLRSSIPHHPAQDHDEPKDGR